MINFQIYQNKFTDAVNEYFNKQCDIPEPLFSAMKYSLLCGGKRLRPSLVFLGAEFMGGEIDKVIPLALGIEFIHTYSLVHDDLPDMDNDTLRRGQPTTHVKFGSGMAILTGDALLNSGFEILLESAVNDNDLLFSCKYISSLCGAGGMIAGQCNDISENVKSLFDVLELYKLKTSALFKAALVGGALPFKPDNNEIAALQNFADNIGIAFQTKDDILEIEEDAEILGKNTDSDKNNDKQTIVKLTDLDSSKKLMTEFYNNALKSIENFSKRGEKLKYLADMMINRNK